MHENGAVSSDPAGSTLERSPPRLQPHDLGAFGASLHIPNKYIPNYMTNYTRYAPHVKRESIANARTALLGKNAVSLRQHGFLVLLDQQLSSCYMLVNC